MLFALLAAPTSLTYCAHSCPTHLSYIYVLTPGCLVLQKQRNIQSTKFIAYELFVWLYILIYFKCTFRPTVRSFLTKLSDGNGVFANHHNTITSSYNLSIHKKLQIKGSKTFQLAFFYNIFNGHGTLMQENSNHNWLLHSSFTVTRVTGQKGYLFPSDYMNWVVFQMYAETVEHWKNFHCKIWNS